MLNWFIRFMLWFLLTLLTQMWASLILYALFSEVSMTNALFLCLIARSWTATCPRLWSQRCPPHPSYQSQFSRRLPSFQQPAPLATAFASAASHTQQELKISWSLWESTPLTSNPTEFTWSSTSRSGWWSLWFGYRKIMKRTCSNSFSNLFCLSKFLIGC